MAKNYNIMITRDSYNLIESEEKTVEVKIAYRNIKNITINDTITFSGYGSTKFKVIRVSKYKNFADVLEHENVSKIMPGMTKAEVGIMFKKLYPRDADAPGVYAIEFKKFEDTSLEKK